MCVVYACQTDIPDDAELRRGSETNTDGAGVAFLRDGRVHWKKDLNTWEPVKAFIEKEKLAFPLAIHFRSASVGGNSNSLAHPFPIGKGVPLWLEGNAEEVLFHNGHLSNWKDLTLKAGLSAKEKFPEGPWSDSRALAWLVYLRGSGVLPFVVDSSRVLLMHATPSTWEGDVYSPGDDHFAFYGAEWIHAPKKGWSQSVNTFARYALSPGRWTQHLENTVEDCEIEEWDAMGNPTPQPATPATPACGVSVLTAKDAYVWTVEELLEVLASLKKEQANAKLASGL
jgi:hypothetical protein